MINNIKKIGMNAFLYTPFSRFFLKYKYMFSPAQLMLIADLAAKASEKGAVFYEIGCAYGDTALFINKYLKEIGAHIDYTVIDTFEGFPAEYVNYEIGVRNVRSEIKDMFAANDEKWVRRKFRTNNIQAQTIKMDACEYDFSIKGKIAFCLLDIDLYLPIKKVLPIIYDNLLDGGVLIVDDCNRDHPDWNGAYHAFVEFTSERKITPEIMHKKLGILRK